MGRVVLTGDSMTIQDVVDIARDHVEVAVHPDAMLRVSRCRNYVEEVMRRGEVVYGLNTGFGKFSETEISPEDLLVLQRNLILSHSCAMGEPLPTEVVRAAMALRANALSGGHSGVRPVIIETLVAMVNKKVHPIIPQKGSLGASGDLAPLAHMVLVMIGEGLAEFEGETLPGAEAMRRARIDTVVLQAKEGLALINGTQIMTAIGALLVWDARRLSKTADIAAALTCEALRAITKAFDPKLHRVRGQAGQIGAAANMLRLLRGSRLCGPRVEGKVQDAYSIRCIPQVHGASKDAIGYVESVVSAEINAVTDNPIIFPDEEDVISGGNFHGQPVALAMDFLGIALSELANISERRTERLVNPQLSAGLPAFLIKDGGLNSGLMIAQYAAASMVSENKVYAHPASVDSIPTSANQEDHVSMGTTAARKAVRILENTRNVIAIELLAASQAVTFRDEGMLAPATAAVYTEIRKEVKPITTDVITHVLMDRVDSMVRSGSVLRAAESITGNLE